MNDIERQIRDAKMASRFRMQGASPLVTAHIDKAGSMAALAMGGRLAHQYDNKNNETISSADDVTIADSVKENKDSAVVKTYTSLSSMTSSGQMNIGSAKQSRPGIISGFWSNRYILAAMPILQLLESSRGHTGEEFLALRAQLEREVQYFQQILLKQQVLPDDMNRMAYLLCTYIDGIGNEITENKRSRLTLLVTFYRDSLGGERCFEDLAHYMADPAEHFEILELYHLILSLGFKGQYHMQDRGDVLLMDLRIRLHTLLYERKPPLAITQVTLAGSTRKPTRFTPLRLCCWGLVICFLGWAGVSFYLHDKSRDIRNAILAWEPPAPRKINIMETLPQPLPKILSEGWLQVREDPRGWLLIFTSDGAFRTGKATLSAEFMQNRNIERLGEALASWPGDLEVIGHTDAQPFRNANNSNLKLSQERAEAVADRLREGSLVNSKYQRDILAVGKGDTEPLADNATEDGRRKNRRVDILWKIGDRKNPSQVDDLNGNNIASE